MNTQNRRRAGKVMAFRWISEENRCGIGYLKPAINSGQTLRNQYAIDALKRKWTCLIAYPVLAVLAIVAIFVLSR